MKKQKTQIPIPVDVVFMPHILMFEHSIIHLN